MADLVAEGAAGVPDAEVRLKAVAEATADDLAWCDGVAVGSPTHMGTIAWEMNAGGTWLRNRSGRKSKAKLAALLLLPAGLRVAVN